MKGGESSSAAGGSSSGAGDSSSAAAAPPAVTAQDDQEAMERSEKFLGVHPVQLVDDIYNFCTQYIKRSADSLEDTLLEDSETKGMHDEVVEGVAGCQTRLVAALDKNIDKLELYVVRNCLRVPAHVDESSALTIASLGGAGPLPPGAATSEQEAVLDEELEMLRRKIQAAVYVNKTLKHKLETSQELLASYGPISAALAQGDASASAAGVEDFAARTVRVLEQEGEIAALERQFVAAEKLHSKENLPVSAAPDGSKLAICRHGVGMPSTKELAKLGTLLGTR